MPPEVELPFEAVSDPRPGPRWEALFRGHWPAYRRWFLSSGDAARPSFLACERALRAHMPELFPVWEELVELTGGGDLEARFLSLYRPPAYMRGCSQAVWTPGLEREPLLVRNYDYAPRFFDGIVLRSEWSGRAVLAVTDCLIGVLDGVNASGLALSLSFGGRAAVGDGFGAPLILRYALELCETAREAGEVLRRVPSHMAYNVTALDASGDYWTAFLRPDRPALFRRTPVSTNHQEEIELPRHAQRTATLERERHLVELLGAEHGTAESFAGEFERPPLRNADYERGFGTLYTAVYRPRRGALELRWPGQRWPLSLEGFEEGRRSVRVPDGSAAQG